MSQCADGGRVWRRGDLLALLHRADRGSRCTRRHFPCRPNGAGHPVRTEPRRPDRPAQWHCFGSSMEAGRASRKVHRATNDVEADLPDDIDRSAARMHGHSAPWLACPTGFERVQRARVGVNGTGSRLGRPCRARFTCAPPPSSPITRNLVHHQPEVPSTIRSNRDGQGTGRVLGQPRLQQCHCDGRRQLPARCARGATHRGDPDRSRRRDANALPTIV